MHSLNSAGHTVMGPALGQWLREHIKHMAICLGQKLWLAMILRQCAAQGHLGRAQRASNQSCTSGPLLLG